MKKEEIENSIKNKNISDFPIKSNLNHIKNINPSIIKIKKENDKFKMFEIKKSNTNIQSKTERDNFFDNTNIEENYSIELDNEEEDEFNSDEYISSTMLDVETNTYIDLTDNKSNDSVSNKPKNKSPRKIKENQNVKKLIKSVGNNNDNYIYKNKKKNSENINSKSKNNKNNRNSPSPKMEKNIDKNKEALYKKLNILNNQNKFEKNEEKEKEKEKEKSKKNLKIEYKFPDKENKNFSMIGYKSPLYILSTKGYPLKLDSINSNFVNLIKKNNNEAKYGFKKMKLDINNVNINIKDKNKTCKHKRAPTMMTDNSMNKNNNMKELIIKQQYTKYNEKNKYKKKDIISPNTKKIGINSMKMLNSVNTINQIETPSSSIANNVNKNNRIIYYNTNNNLIKNSNTITINNNNIISTINLNNIKNLSNISHINRIIFSPLKKRINKTTNRNTTPSYSYNPFHSNSISIDNNNNISNNKNNSNYKISDKLLTYNLQEQKYLSRNRTFKNKRRLNNKNKFFNLLLNKKKINLIYGKDLVNYKKNSKSKSPKIKNKINNLTKITNNLIKKNLKNIQLKSLGFKNFKSKNAKSNISKNSYLNSYTNRKQQVQINNKHNLYKRDKKYFSKQFIYIKKENLSNIVRQQNKKTYENNPFNQENKNNKNLSLSKSNKRYANGGHSENKDKDLNANLTSVNLIKNAIKSKKIKLEIGNKKKNKYRTKTLMEEDYLRDILINNNDQKEKEVQNEKENYFKDYKYYKNTNKSASNNISLNPNNFKTANSKYKERKTKHSPLSGKDIIIKSPSEKHDINFNININMNNNDYKKLIYYYHGHHNSSINYSYINSKEKNSNLSINQTKKNGEKNISIGKEFYRKRDSIENFNNEFQLNKKIYNDNNSNYNSNIVNKRKGFNHLYNNSENIPNSFCNNFNTNYNNFYEEYYDNISTIINKNKNNHNFYVSKNIRKQLSKNKTNNKNEFKSIDNKEEKKLKGKNQMSNHQKKEYNKLDNNNTFTNSEIDQSKSTNTKGNSNANIKLSNNNSSNNNFIKINHSINANLSKNKRIKNQKQKYSQGKIKKQNETNENFDEQIDDNLPSLDNYIYNFYENKNFNNE